MDLQPAYPFARPHRKLREVERLVHALVRGHPACSLQQRNRQEGETLSVWARCIAAWVGRSVFFEPTLSSTNGDRKQLEGRL